MTTLLIDGDIIAYKHAVVGQRVIEWDDDVVSVSFEASPAKARAADQIAGLADKLECDDIVVALSCPDSNFRKAILPSYKHNRDPAKKPVGLKVMRNWLAEAFPSFERPGLEGDDCIGILATSKRIIKGDKIVWSADKDFYSVPCVFYRDTEGEVETITEEMADYHHLLQTLMGDTVDGYKGCPGIGKVGAAKLLDAATEEGNPSWWTVVVGAYEKAGLGEGEALIQARVARILRASDYDFKKKQPILWTP